MSTGVPNIIPYSTSTSTSTSTPQTQGKMAADALPPGSVPSASELDIENTDIKTATGVSLSEEQRTIVGSVLDLFVGRPSLKKLQLWADDATFADPITKAQGRTQYEPQWYGLQTGFSSIERLDHKVTSGGYPITMDLKTKYKVKGIGKEETIVSVVEIFTKDGKISEVRDKWDGKDLKEGAFATAMRNLNSVAVPKFVSVPKNEEEDQKRGN